MKIENGNYVCSNDGEWRINNSGLQADRFAVPATIATICIAREKLGRKYFQRKKINIYKINSNLIDTTWLLPERFRLAFYVLLELNSRVKLGSQDSESKF